jgi:hypothetical protein
MIRTGAGAYTTDAQLTHEYGGLEFYASGVAIGDIIAGDGAGSMALVTSTGHSAGDVLTRQSDGSVDYQAPPSPILVPGLIFIVDPDDIWIDFQDLTGSNFQYRSAVAVEASPDGDKEIQLDFGMVPTPLPPGTPKLRCVISGNTTSAGLRCKVKPIWIQGGDNDDITAAGNDEGSTDCPLFSGYAANDLIVQDVALDAASFVAGEELFMRIVFVDHANWPDVTTYWKFYVFWE